MEDLSWLEKLGLTPLAGVVVNGHFAKLGPGALALLDQLDTDRPTVAAQINLLDDGSANQPEVAVYIANGEPEEPPREEPMEVSDNHAVRRILPRHLHPVHEVCVFRQQHQQDRDLADV